MHAVQTVVRDVTLRYCAVIRSDIYRTVRCGMVDHGEVRHGTIRFGTEYGKARCSTIWYGAVQNGMARDSTVQEAKLRYGTIQ